MNSGNPPHSAPPSSLAGRAIQPRYNELVQDCRKLVMNFLAGRLGDVFSQADDTLFECAEKAETNQVQTLFFDSMRDIRRQKPAIERHYHQQIGRNIDHFLAGRRLNETSAPAEASTLSLIDNEEYEESLQISNMVSRVKARCAEALFALDQRVALLTGGQKIDELDNPFGPQAIANGFRQALADTSFPLRIKTVLYVLFDQQVMHELDELYNAMNSRLVEAGVLPNLRLAAQKKESRPTAQQPRQPESAEQPAHPSETQGVAAPAGFAAPPDLSAPPSADPAQLFAGLSSLLAESRQRAPNAPLLGGTQSIVSFAPPTATRTYSADTLLAALDALQRRSAQELASRLTQPQHVGELKSSLDQALRSTTDNPDEHRLSDREADLIDLVGMLFDFILEDENLPNRCKTLLSHLHTPYLKVALQDRALFTRHDHPARKLLNSMAQAGVLYGGEDENDGLTNKLHWVVEQIIQHYDQGTSLFESLQQEFDEHVASLRHRIELRERREVEAAKGRDRLLGARRQALEAVAGAIGSRDLPAVIRNFLELTWSDVLVFVLLRHGTDSEQWQQAVQVAETLAWSGTPLDAEGQKRLQGLRVKLLEELRRGLELLGGYHEDGIRRLLQDLVACQHAVQSKQPSLADRLSPKLPDSPLGAMLGEDAALLDAPRPSGLSSKAQALMEELKHLEFGTWFEFSDGKSTRTLKLSWYSPTTRNYMFVDHSGQRVAIKPITLLASEMEAGLARVVKQGGQNTPPLMDRALGAIYRVLQKITGRTTD